MKAFKFVHTADLHLDSPFQGIGRVEPEVQQSLCMASIQAFQNIVHLCIKESVDFLLIAGDLYDGASGSLKAQLCCRDAFQQLTDRGIRVFIAHGNHDHCGGWRADLDWPEGVHFFSAAQVESLPIFKDGEEIARIHGISYPERAITENYLLKFLPAKGAPYSIGLLHTNVGSVKGHANYAPCTLGELQMTGYDYWALGHVHTYQVLHAGKPLIIYPGTPQGRHLLEAGPKGCCLVEVGTHGTTQHRFVETDAVRWLNLEVSIAGVTRLEDLLLQLEAALDELDQPEVSRAHMVQIRLTGRGPLYGDLRRYGLLEDLQERLREERWGSKQFLWVRALENETEPDLSLDTLREEESLAGDYLKLTAQAQNLQEHPELVPILEEALKPLFKERMIRKILKEPDLAKMEELIKRSEQAGIELFHLEVNR